MGSIWSDNSYVKEVNRNVTRIWNRKNQNTPQDNKEVGSNFNDWRMPISTFAENESYLTERLQENACVGKYEISNDLWQNSCGVVNEITQLFQKTLHVVSARKYPCLTFGDLVKQGSSREGLKIRQPDEFDMILPFTIEGVDICAVPALDNNGEQVFPLVNLEISDNGQTKTVMSCDQYQSLRTDGVFETRGSNLILNAMCFQTRVISSIMDTTISEIQKAIDEQMPDGTCSFTLNKASVFPPTYRFKISIESKADVDELSYGRNLFATLRQSALVPKWSKESKAIEFDIVPGLLLPSGSVPNPDGSLPLTWDRYAVMKWVHKGRYVDDYPDPNLLWKESVCGFEKHIIDVSCKNESYLYILTACRIMKAYINGLDKSSQLFCLVSSYHLKNIAIHSILLQLEVSGVREALSYFLTFLEISIEQEFLPHHFYDNPNICRMFPNFQSEDNRKRVNLFRDIHHHHFTRAKLSLKEMQADLRELFTGSCYPGNQQIIDSFRDLCSVYDKTNTGR
ncbi:uncharacterized protein LOC132544886 [Ylistrum balloti]|uniref:uncharacterized protein LOC132544886 n=1 Tax=Ylistrum balloti TaxID=509963 RepID=UPI002905BF48|nr:uncharacterized protein LOC132544886 [Ylistrum balloti]